MPENYEQSALRHFSDAEKLANSGSLGGAGHLIGFSAECAIKYCVANLRPENEVPHVHFPQIIEAAKKQLQGRRQSAMHNTLKRPELMLGWKIEQRYSPDNTITQDTYNKWREHASSIIFASGLRR
ncbi:hypothetical protein [Pseudomonas salomonii]|uniref:hypothetical protein n=1 Tax=Pseudomonas salomonii TaxID=191391 RepID=UPI00115FFB38|nr:hypothetical protein [Pseudomonas salomonii]